MIDEMWMMRPQRRSFICGTSARVSAMHEVRFSSTMRSQASSVISSIACGLLLPALLTRMSTLPICLERGVGQLAAPRSRLVMSATK